MQTLTLGKIIRPHGFRGDFLAEISEEAIPSGLQADQPLYLRDTAGNLVEHAIVTAEKMHLGWKLHLKGIESDEQVKALRGKLLLIPREGAPPLNEGEFLVSDLIGFEVLASENGTVIGILSAIEPVESPLGIRSTDRWWIEGESGEIAIPGIRRYIEKVDTENRRIVVRHMDELVL